MSEDAMTPDLAERVRLLFAAANRRDLDTLMSFYAPDAVWETTLITLDGSTAIQERFEEWFDAFDELEFELEEILDLGSGVIFAVVNQRGRPAGTSSSGGHIQRQEAYVGVWHEGRVTRVTTFLDIDQARAAAERLADERG